jgi:hypothetical protein
MLSCPRSVLLPVRNIKRLTDALYHHTRVIIFPKMETSMKNALGLKKRRSFPHRAVQLFLLGVVSLLFGAMVVPRWIPQPVYEGACITALPADGELLVYDFYVCPVGYMKIDGVYPISSFRQGWLDQRFAQTATGPDYIQHAFSGSSGVAMYPDSSNEPTLAVYYDLETKLYLVKAATLDVQAYSDDSSFTACYGEIKEVLCISVLELEYWYLPTDIGRYIRVWVAWLQR